jgi:two-component system CheB/CheR fusion protein
VIRSIAARTAASATSLDEFASDFDGRLAALGRTQRMLARSDAFAIDLEELVHEELLAHAIGHCVAVKGPGVRLPQKVAENLGLAIHELVTNAIKFGALVGQGQGQGQGPQASLTWKVDGDRLVLEWRETGVAALNTAPTRSGFGREWLEHGLTYQLGAQTRLEFLPAGVSCMIALPLHLVAMEMGHEQDPGATQRYRPLA